MILLMLLLFANQTKSVSPTIKLSIISLVHEIDRSPAFVKTLYHLILFIYSFKRNKGESCRKWLTHYAKKGIVL